MSDNSIKFTFDKLELQDKQMIKHLTTFDDIVVTKLKSGNLAIISLNENKISFPIKQNVLLEKEEKKKIPSIGCKNSQLFRKGSLKNKVIN